MGQIQSVLCVVRMAVFMSMRVVVRMTVGVAVAMVRRLSGSLRMCRVVVMAVHLAVFVGMPLIRIGLAMRAGIFIEDQRFHSDRHGP